MWHVVLHAAPGVMTNGPTWSSGEIALTTLLLTPVELQTPLAVTFEEAIAALEQLPQMFCEADGWFDWTSPANRPRWQISGQLHDRGASLAHIEVKFDGAATSAQLDALLSAFGAPAQAFVIQLVREAIFLDVANFRRLLQPEL